MAQFYDLFEAYSHNLLPTEGGYVISVFFDENSAYTRYEMISYGNVKDIYKTEDGITFQADGRKLYILMEPQNYTGKQVEPCYRDDRHKIPYRFKELNIHTSKRQDKVMVGKEPVETYTSFTIANETGYNKSYICFKADDTAETLAGYFHHSLWKEVQIPRVDANKAVELIRDVLPAVMTPFGIE